MSPRGALTVSAGAWLPAGLPPSLHRVHLIVPVCVVEGCSVFPNLAGTEVSEFSKALARSDLYSHSITAEKGGSRASGSIQGNQTQPVWWFLSRW